MKEQGIEPPTTPKQESFFIKDGLTKKIRHKIAKKERRIQLKEHREKKKGRGINKCVDEENKKKQKTKD